MDGTIQELKRYYGVSAENIIANGYNLKRKGTKYHCNNHLAHKNGDKNPSMGWDKEALQFYCFTCGHKLDIYNYFTEVENKEHKEILEMLGGSSQKKTSFSPELMELKDECKKYLNTRGIADNSITYFKIKSYKNNIAFSYYSDNQLVGVKYREPIKTPAGAKYCSITGSVMTLYNKDNIELDKPLVVAEGEIDSMIIWQAGFTNVVSVGRGSQSLKRTMEQEKHIFDSVPTIIIASDNDAAGGEMDKQALEMYPSKTKLVDKKLMNGYNDINILHHFKGAEAVKELINSAVLKIEGIRELDNKPYECMKNVSKTFIPTGIGTLDEAINDLQQKQVTVISGRTSDGKTTFVNQVIINAIDHNARVLLVTGEGVQERIINSIYRGAIGRNTDYITPVKINKVVEYEPTAEALEALRLWHRGKFDLFSKGDSKLKTTTELFEMLREQIRLKRYDLVIIDNLMSILAYGNSIDKLDAQGDFMQNCCDLAKAESTHIILVVHPNKTLAKGQIMELEQVSGSQDIANKADNIIIVRREHDEDKREETGADGDITLRKNRYYSKLVTVKTVFDAETVTLCEMVNGAPVVRSSNFTKYLKGDKSVFSKTVQTTIKEWE